MDALKTPQAPAEPPLPTLADFLPIDDPLAPLSGAAGRRVGMAQAQDLQQRAHGLRLADDFLAGGDLIRPALRELRTAVKLYRENTHSSDVGRELLRQIGELAQITGWVASDAGQHAEAERVYRLGMSAARQAEDFTLVGHLAGSLAYQMTNTGQGVAGLTLARAALHEAGPAAHPKARALYLDRVAWAHTRAGDAQSAMRTLENADAALADRENAEAPQFLYWVSESELRIMRARVFTELRRPLRAVPLLREVLSEYEQTHAREMALYLSWLAVALADANEPEEAAVATTRILSFSQGLSSDRTRGRLSVVRERLREYDKVPEVAAVLNEAA